MTPRIINNHIVIKSTNPAQMQAMFPAMKTTQINGDTFCAVPHTLETAKIFNNLGVKTPSPIRTQYEWPGRYKPRWYQIETAEFFTMYMRAHCLNAPRTGKTLSALWAADYLRQQGTVNKTLIVAPLSTLWDVWQQNIFESFPLRTFCILHGSREKRLKLLATDCNFYVINHHGVKIIEKDLAKRPDINLVIVDECFVAGTKVSTPSGERCIDTLETGDLVETSWGPKKITYVFKKLASKLVKITFEDGTYVECTPEHPFATDEGWVTAKKLSGKKCLEGAYLRDMRDKIHAEAGCCEKPSAFLREGVLGRSYATHPRDKSLPSLWKRIYDRICEVGSEVLLKRLWDTVQGQWRIRSLQAVQSMQETILRPFTNGEVSPARNLLPVVLHEVEMGSAPGGYGGRCEKWGAKETRSASMEQRGPIRPRSGCEEETSNKETDRDLQEKQRGQWYRNHQARETSPATFASEFRAQRNNKDQDAERLRISYLLQSGLWGQESKDSCRSGWRQSRVSKTPCTGQKERKVSGGIRVVSVQNIEPSGQVAVWNLEVAGPQDYIANGKVVHNCATMRNSRAKTLFKPLDRVINKQGHIRLSWGLTGTPTPNEPTDAFGQCKLITPENYSGHFTSFKRETMVQVAQFKWVKKRSAEESVTRILSPSIRFERTVCTDMEPCLIDRRAELSADQQKSYKELNRQASSEVRGDTITAINAAVLMSKLCQIACGVAYAADGSLVKFDFGPRLSVLEELIEQNNEKVLVFVPFTGALNALADKLRKRWSVAIVDGSVTPRKRAQIFQDFRSLKDPHVLVCHPQVMAHGLDLSTASLSIWYAPYWKAEYYQQANARTDGSGQKVKIDIARIYATPEERRIYSVLDGKGRFQDIVLGMVKNG